MADLSPDALTLRAKIKALEALQAFVDAFEIQKRELLTTFEEIAKGSPQLSQEELWSWAFDQVDLDLSIETAGLDDSAEGGEGEPEEEEDEGPEDDGEDRAQEKGDRLEEQQKDPEAHLTAWNEHNAMSPGKKVRCDVCQGDIEPKDSAWLFVDRKNRKRYTCSPECANSLETTMKTVGS